MIPFYKKYARTLLDVAVLIATAYLILRLIAYLYSVVEPLFWCLLVFICFEPMARFLHRHGLKKSFASAVSVVTLILFFTLLIGLLSYLFVLQVVRFSSRLPVYTHAFSQQLINNIAAFQQWLHGRGIPVNLAPQLSAWTNTVSQQSSHWLSVLFNGIISILSSFSHTFYSLILGVLLAYFLSVESDQWHRVLLRAPTPIRSSAAFLRNHVFEDILHYLRAQLILIAITFVLTLIPLWFLGVSSPIFVAALVAFSSVVPIVGIGATFFPWILYLLVTGQIPLCLWIVGLYVVLGLFRQVIDPKVIGDSLGVSAFTMLVLIILFGSLFGVVGIILSPFLTILVNKLYRQGYLKQWVRLPDQTNR